MRIDLVEAGGLVIRRAEPVLLHTGTTADSIANHEFRRFAGHDHTGATGTHDFIDSDGANVRLAIVHPATHRRIE